MQQDNLNIYMLVIAGTVFSILVTITVILFYIRYQRNLATQQLKMQEAQLQHQKDLLYAVIQSQEEERKRIGQDLHDDVGAALSNLRMYVERHMTESSEKLPGISVGQHTKTSIDKIIADVRNISHNLSPASLDLYGFAAAVEELTDMIGHDANLRILIMNHAEQTLAQIEPAKGLALYRVLEELLTNTVKHAEATQIYIAFLPGDRFLKISYTDNGIGLHLPKDQKRGIGLKNIESRLSMIQAVFTMRKNSAEGFGIDITIPLND